MTNIEWRVVPTIKCLEVSNTGLVRFIESYNLHTAGRTLSRNRPLKLTGFGYYQVGLKGTNYSVHNMVAEAFIGPKPGPKYRVDHINNNKLDNSPSNLRWVLHSSNVHRALYTGNRRFFYEGELWLIKKLLSFKIPYITIGKMFMCSTMLIQDIKKGLKNSHIRINPNCDIISERIK